MGEPCQGIIGRDRLDRHPHGLREGLVGAGAQLAQDSLDLGECLLDRREVGRVGRKKEQVAVPCFDGLANSGGLVDKV